MEKQEAGVMPLDSTVGEGGSTNLLYLSVFIANDQEYQIVNSVNTISSITAWSECDTSEVSVITSGHWIYLRPGRSSPGQVCLHPDAAPTGWTDS